MTTELTPYLHILHSMEPNDINEAACRRLDALLNRCTVNLAADLTGFTRKTLYRWLDSDIPLDAMDYKQAAWFILMTETSPKLLMLLDRPPTKNRRMARGILEMNGENYE